MIRMTGIILTLLLAVNLLALPRYAEATPLAEVYYTETYSGGEWKYEYFIKNTTDPLLLPGFDIYDLFLYLDYAAYVAGQPAGWDSFEGFGFIEFFSLNPGAPPFGTDVPPGGVLGGFLIASAFQLGDLLYEVMFTDPADPFNPVFYGPTYAAPLQDVAPIPEPGTMLLLGSGLLSLITARRLKSRAKRLSSAS